MKGNNLQKVLRLGSYLAQNPLQIRRYLRESIGSESPIELALPWISFAAIDFLEDYIDPDHTVVEFGGGGSTLFFGKRAKKVLCIESHKEWSQKIEAASRLLSLTNVEIEVLPYDSQDLESYRKSKNLHRIDEESFDIILVDGYEEDVQLRPTCFFHAENHVNPGGIVIVDDSWRYPIIRKENKANNRSEFRSIGPCRPGVTTTDIYHY